MLHASVLWTVMTQKLNDLKKQVLKTSTRNLYLRFFILPVLRLMIVHRTETCSMQ